MAKYPNSPVPSYEHVAASRWKTVISIFDDGNEQRRQKWTAPQYDITLQYNAIRATAMSTIWNFFEARKGAYEAFHYYIGEAWGEKQDVKGAYIAVADGTATAFTLPCKNSCSVTIYQNGSVIGSSLVVVNATVGVDDADTLSLGMTPSSGDVLTADFTGYQKVRCRFKDDTLSRSLFEPGLYKMTVELKGLPPAT